MTVLYAILVFAGIVGLCVAIAHYADGTLGTTTTVERVHRHGCNGKDCDCFSSEDPS